MKEIIKKIETHWFKNLETNLDVFSNLEKKIQFTLPLDYKEFITWSNGGEGRIGDNYISLWKVEDVFILNEEYQIQKYLSNNCLAIGTDGGDICYGFKLSEGFTIFKCPLGDLDINEITDIAESFKGFIEKAIIKEI